MIGTEDGPLATVNQVAKLSWHSLDEFKADANRVDDDRLSEMRGWALAGEQDADRPGTGRNPKARRLYRQMREAADEELDRRGLLWDEGQRQSEYSDGAEAAKPQQPEDEQSSAISGVPKAEHASAHGRTRIMYIESKADGLTGPARIGRVSFSKRGRTIYYQGRAFQSLGGVGFKSNYYDVETGDEYWISGPKRDGSDRLYGESTPVEIDDDVREEYWRDIRGLPTRSSSRIANH